MTCRAVCHCCIACPSPLLLCPHHPLLRHPNRACGRRSRRCLRRWRPWAALRRRCPSTCCRAPYRSTLTRCAGCAARGVGCSAGLTPWTARGPPPACPAQVLGQRVAAATAGTPRPARCFQKIGGLVAGACSPMHSNNLRATSPVAGFGFGQDTHGLQRVWWLGRLAQHKPHCRHVYAHPRTQPRAA